MNETHSQGMQKRIDFLGRWAFAFFTVFIVQVSWLGNSIRAEKYDILFRVGIGAAAVFAVACLGFAWVTYRNIKRLEESKNERP
ncbi:MAG: hypothetical protein OXU62_12975 [Gammaproteobacteria bacterium]|nr:hypothetical protein [Gammaproteobacteria bacterium]